jgi:uncharacterized membrane protein YphA (DoxX/SURF4 family)
MRSASLPGRPAHSVVAWLLTCTVLEHAARIAIASPFLISGFLKLADFGGATAEVAGLGLQPAGYFAVAVIVAQLGGSVLFLPRRFCWLGAGVLSVFTATATVLAHAFWLFPAAERGHQAATFFEHVAIVGGFAAAAMLSYERQARSSATKGHPIQ